MWASGARLLSPEPPGGAPNRAIIHAVMDDSALRSPTAALLLTAALFSVGCDTISSDFQDLLDQITPTSPAEAGEWATDFGDSENQQRGITLLGTAPWGGEDEYLRLYRTCVEGPFDPLVKAAAIRALAHHGDPGDAKLIADQLENPTVYVRHEAAKGLQRLHEPTIADTIWQRLVVEEDGSVRVELAIALGQYARDPVFQALVLALEYQELAVNLAAADSLRTLTGQDHGLDARSWLAWYDTVEAPFSREEIYLYPVYTRPLGLLDKINFLNPTVWEKPSLPRGLEAIGRRSTWAEGPAQTEEGS